MSIYERTSLGYWSLRAPTPEERAELDANESVRLARVEIADAKRHGRGPSSVGHEAGGAPPPGPPLVVVPAEPVDWEAFVERHGLDRGALHRLQEWTAANVPDRRIGPGSIELQCSACELPVRVGPTGQRAVFAVGAKVLCPACVHHLQRRMQEEEDR
ncbi:MAG: hypothetical protein EOP01_02080 [Propionibacteriaceae bacterium]|nr:MAG: hypothetical protein EOP01_02080 [Propionibacteriaceae bacterium]